MDCIIRPARPDEALSLAELDGAAGEFAWTPGQYRAALAGSGGQAVLVLGTDAGVAGCVVFAVVAGEGGIYRIVTAPSVRRRGLARELLDTALQRMRAAGACRCVLEVRESNLAARSLYVSAGFSLDGARKGYYGHPTHPGGREDALLMSLNLED